MTHGNKEVKEKKSKLLEKRHSKKAKIKLEYINKILHFDLKSGKNNNQKKSPHFNFNITQKISLFINKNPNAIVKNGNQYNKKKLDFFKKKQINISRIKQKHSDENKEDDENKENRDPNMLF